MRRTMEKEGSFVGKLAWKRAENVPLTLFSPTNADPFDDESITRPIATALTHVNGAFLPVMSIAQTLVG